MGGPVCEWGVSTEKGAVYETCAPSQKKYIFRKVTAVWVAALRKMFCFSKAAHVYEIDVSFQKRPPVYERGACLRIV